MTAFHAKLIKCTIAGVLACGIQSAIATDDNAPAENAGNSPARVDFLDAAYLPGLERVVVVGHHGLIGLVEVGDAQARLSLVTGLPNEDFSALAKLNDTEALIGSSSGRIYHFDGKSLTEIAALSEFEEPVLDIGVDGNEIWVVGARGLIARSSDGKTFENVEIRDVTQPLAEFPGADPADWYFGVSNLNPDSIEFNATIGGVPAVAEEDYVMFPDEGFVQIAKELDMDPAPTISFTFSPGPPFRLGDVSWNVVLVGDGKVTIAGEFGMILQSSDNGDTWVRRDSRIVPREPEPAYWMAGVQQGSQLWLTGAAGVSQVSHDGGVTWADNPKPGREGIFGITLAADGLPVIAGAVGLIGSLKDGDWQLADRTQLKLLSWLKTPITLPDGSLLVMGGRATAIHYKDGEFVRVPVTF